MEKRPQIVVDETMPGIDVLFSDIANITKTPGRYIDNGVLLEADALLCRSTTQVNQELLQNTKVKFVGTATIGTDHLDSTWLDSNQIAWSNAAGCNANAVAQYVLSTIAFWCRVNDKDFSSLKIGIVGAGNVGTVLSNYLQKIGVKYLLNDPPLSETNDQRCFYPLKEIMQCDVISLHVPLEIRGDYSTHHFFDDKRLNSLTNDQLLINTSRGAVIDNKALEIYLDNEASAQVVLDVFENEPNISHKLVKNSFIATPHIAGHTLEGKLRGSYLVYKAFCKCFNLPIEIQEKTLYPYKNQSDSCSSGLSNSLLDIYDIGAQSNQLKSVSKEELFNEFDKLRKNASLLPNGLIRRDYSGWEVDSGNDILSRLI